MNVLLTGSPICTTDSRPLSAAAKRASFMIPTEDKEAVISRFAHLRLPPHCAKPNPEKGGAKYIIGDVGMYLSLSSSVTGLFLALSLLYFLSLYLILLSIAS